MFCPTCRTENSNANNYCIAGGHSLNTKTLGKKPVSGGLEFCSSCGTKNRFSSTYCNHCGIDVTKLKVSDVTPFVKQKVNTQNFTASKDTSAKQSFITGLISSAIGALLILFFSFGVMNYSEGKVIDFVAEEGERLTSEGLRSGFFISEELSSELEIPITLPNLYNVWTFAALLNGVNAEASLNYAYDFFDYGDVERFSVKSSNFFSIGLVFMFLALIGMGLYIGWKAKKTNGELILPLLLGIVFYAVFVMICAWIANLNFSLGQVGSGNFWVDANITFNAFSSIFKTLFIGAIVAGLAAFVTKYGRGSISAVQQLPGWKKCTVLSGAAMAVILTTSSLFIYIYLQLYLNDFNRAFDEQGIWITNMLAAVSIPHALHFANLASIDIQAFEHYNLMTRGTLSALMSKKDFVANFADTLSDKEEVRLLYSLKGGLWYLPKFIVLIPISLFIFIGIRFFHSLKTNLKDLLLLSGLYAVLMAITSRFSKMELIFMEDFGLDMGATLITALLMPFLLAFISLAVGVFLREKRNDAKVV
ncbi:zinc ribbon domain-containing protein [Sporosarcina ureae]|uniref:zinc ribbon domain-containing protein n=1 Tax=Sporosarcina ureae TaxID=1571 RepID=UPI0026EF2EEF|nr:zinc ribbon domain-containing protein [Sporosarcina ureae]